MNKLLLDDKPLIILPSLAEKIGLNESIILQQLHYWLLESKHFKDGTKWIYNTYEDWQKQFPFWSISTIRRTITKLENQNLVIVGNFNKLKIDNTKWYSINYNHLDDMNRPSVQNEQTECSNWTDELPKMNRPLPETTTEISSDINVDDASAEKILIEKYMQFGAISGFDIPESQKISVRQVIKAGVPLNDAITYLEECFKQYPKKHARDRINSFNYCATFILNKYTDKQKVATGTGYQHPKQPIQQQGRDIPDGFELDLTAGEDWR